jgi:hypothetical protein
MIAFSWFLKVTQVNPWNMRRRNRRRRRTNRKTGSSNRGREKENSKRLSPNIKTGHS